MAKAPKPISKAAGEAAAQKASLADPNYQAARNSLQLQLHQYGDNLALQGGRYDRQYGQDLGNLGVQNAQGARFVSPDVGSYGWNETVAKKGDSFSGVLNKPSGDVSAQYTNFNQVDPNTSSGKAFTDQGNDYAARGMIQSGDARGIGTGYLNDRANLGTNFTQQLTNAQHARQNYQGDLQNQASAYIGQTSDSLNQARLAALSNYNNQQTTNATRLALGLK